MRKALAVIVLAAVGGGAFLLLTAGDDVRSDDEVIRDWADTLRGGDPEAAAELFALPSVVENGTPPVELADRADAVAFNRALPCGAELIDIESEAVGTVATFELTDRPGGSCGAGVGELARTIFVIRDGLIAEWRRAPDPAPVGSSA